MSKWHRRILDRMRPLDWVVVVGLLVFGLYQGMRLVWAAISSVPNNLVYQGHLTKAGGAPLNAGIYDLKFEFYDSSTDGTLKCDWTSTGIRVNSNGNFRATIGGDGSGSCLDIQKTLRDNGALYMAISVAPNGGAFETLLPRIKIGGVARAHHAQNAVFSEMVSTTSGAPEATDCDNSVEYGRLRVDITNDLFYFCTTSGWVASLVNSPSFGSQTFSTPGNSTFTVPSGVTSIYIRAWGGGGGGGYGSGCGGAQGGGGGYAAKNSYVVTPGQNLSVIVGGGGLGGSAGGTGGGGGTGLTGTGTGKGGNAGTPPDSGRGGGGGGASFVALTNGTILVAAGGGAGGGGCYCWQYCGSPGAGGGGGEIGELATFSATNFSIAKPGAAGSQSSHDGENSASSNGSPGGGGGGFNGGSAGVMTTYAGSGGGGGSCFGDIVAHGYSLNPANAGYPGLGTSGQGGLSGTTNSSGKAGMVIISW